VTGIAHDAAAPPDRRRWNLLADNPIVRAIGRARLPLGAKLIAGFAVVAALLAVVAVLGLVALGKSNSRSGKLPNLQAYISYEAIVKSDAEVLSDAIDFRRSLGGGFASANGAIVTDLKRLCLDAGLGTCGLSTEGSVRFPIRLDQIAPSLSQRLAAGALIFYPLNGLATDARAAGYTSSIHSALRRAARFATSFRRQITGLANRTRAHQRALVVANRRSFIDSRNLLIGAGAGGFALAVVLGLLLAASVVAPLRRTQEGLSTIAGGDFSGQVDVPNRDEIGALAADVNRMNDELRRLYGELETASRHKSDFLATMSHELRTPLNAIIGFSEVLHEQMFGELNERQLAYVNDVLEAGRHLLSLINDVLDLAKIEAGRMDLELSEVALSDLLRSALSMNADRAERGEIALALHTDPTEIPITADERRVRQVVFNLLSNAIKFTPSGGRIDITVQADDSQVEVAVADTGPGIPAAEIDTIFEEFEQTAEGKKVEGTGLGLPLSRRLVELHGGRLWVESEPGCGSTFRFTLPVEAHA
jgi:signal transduction histidine kinase